MQQNQNNHLEKQTLELCDCASEVAILVIVSSSGKVGKSSFKSSAKEETLPSNFSYDLRTLSYTALSASLSSPLVCSIL